VSTLSALAGAFEVGRPSGAGHDQVAEEIGCIDLVVGGRIRPGQELWGPTRRASLGEGRKPFPVLG
jgi:hypothetical protein